jgi:hypothetical protein
MLTNSPDLRNWSSHEKSFSIILKLKIDRNTGLQAQKCTEIQNHRGGLQKSISTECSPTYIARVCGTGVHDQSFSHELKDYKKSYVWKSRAAVLFPENSLSLWT